MLVILQHLQKKLKREIFTAIIEMKTSFVLLKVAFGLKWV